MLDHVFTDAISALRDAFGNAFLERQAFEEHFNSDILLGDLVWETTYGLPGEGASPTSCCTHHAELAKPQPGNLPNLVYRRSCRQAARN